MRPPGFESYWDNVDAELAGLPAKPVLEEVPLRSNEHATLYGLRLTSIGPYRIFGYLSVPRGDGPFPGMLLTPRYGSVNHIPDYNDRLRYVCLQLMHRGQRLADQPYAASYPGLLTENIDDADQYIYRGIVADCLRAAEFLLEHPAIDRKRLAIHGDDLALITASRRPGYGTVLASGLMFYRLSEARHRTTGYPIEEINEYLRAYPEDSSDAEATLTLYDPAHHATGITSEVILTAGGDAAWLDLLVDELSGETHLYRLTQRGGTDHDRLDEILATRLNVPPMTRFARAYRS